MTEFATAVEVLARLVAFDTTSRHSNLPLIRWVEAWLAERGIACRVTTDASGTKANLHALVGPRVAGGLALSGHVDCVPVDGQVWLADPFALRRAHGRLIGRGTADMKGFVACALAILPALARLPLARPVQLCLTHDEETDCAGARALAPLLGTTEPLPATCIVGEPTLLAPVIGQKGYQSWNASVTGRAGHSSRTNATANALQAAAEAVAWLSAQARAQARTGRRADGFDPPHSTIHVGTFTAGTILNIVPDRADFTFEMRTIPGDDAAALIDGLTTLMATEVMPPLQAIAPESAFDVAVRAATPGFALPDRAPLALRVQALTGHNQARRVSYGTEAGFFQARGIETLVCGPGDIAQAHQPEEFVTEAQIAACLDLLRRLGEDLAA